MNRRLRIVGRTLVGMVALATVGAVVCLDTVDCRPYFREAYYAETAARLKTQTNLFARGELAAGFGRARLSPTLNTAAVQPENGQFQSVPLAGYGNRRGKPATGIHDEVYVKAIAFKVGDQLGVMVGADALIVPREVTECAVERLGRELHLARDQLYLGATHTHCSLGGWGEGFVGEAFAGPFQPAVRAWFAECIVAAVKAAVADLQPAEFGHGHFEAPQFIRNRLVGELGRVDPEFSFAWVRQLGGKSGVIGVYGAHATVLPSEMMGFSGDYPGCWARAVEQATGGMAMFLAGGVGSHSPVPGSKGFAGAEHMGQALAEALAAQMAKTPLTNSVTFARLGLEVSLPPLNLRLSDGVRLRPWLARRILTKQTRSFLQVFRLNDAVWLSTPSDFSGELALNLKDYVHARGGEAVITSFNGDYLGYLIPGRYYHLAGYEPRLMSFFGPNMPDYFDELIRGLASRALTP